MNREDRAKQFMPFDALKGLQEELRKREERRLRVNKHELTEEEIVSLNGLLTRLKKNDVVAINYYRNGRYITTKGAVKRISSAYQFIEIEGGKIYFDDLLNVDLLSQS